MSCANVLQEEYRREQLEWTFIHFPDNGDCITLIEKKPNGIIPTLDEQCIIGRATDDRFARELYKKSETNSRWAISVSALSEQSESMTIVLFGQSGVFGVVIEGGGFCTVC